MRTGLLAAVLLTCFVVLACADNVVCNAPYIRHANTCCLDQNTNGICDPDEVGQPLAGAHTAAAPPANPCPNNESYNVLADVHSYADAREMLKHGDLRWGDTVGADRISKMSDEQLASAYQIHEVQGRLLACNVCPTSGPGNGTLQPVTGAWRQDFGGRDVRTLADLRQFFVDAMVINGNATGAHEYSQMSDEQMSHFGQPDPEGYIRLYERPDGLWLCSSEPVGPIRKGMEITQPAS